MLQQMQSQLSHSRNFLPKQSLATCFINTYGLFMHRCNNPNKIKWKNSETYIRDAIT